MKVVVLLLCLFASAFCAPLKSFRTIEERLGWDTCKTYGCLGLGQECSTDAYTAGVDCAGNSTTECSNYCAYPMRCTRDSADVAKTCKLTTLSQLCTTVADCTIAYHEHMVCSSGRCAIDTTNRLPNDYCSSSSNCRGASTCVNGRCTGVASGDACTSTLDCAPSLYCSAGVCTPRDNGAVCTSYESCTFAYSCIAGSCVADHTRTSGQLCNVGYNCQDGLLCVLHEGDVQNTCRVPSSPEAGQVCEDHTDCSGDAVSCTCDKAGTDRCTVATPNRCSEADNAHSVCLENAGCHQESDLFRYGSCASVACGSTGVSVESCSYVSAHESEREACYLAWSSAATMSSWISVFLSFF